MAKYKQPTGLAEGIYFGLSEDIYHDDPAFSHSGMVDILISPYDYWFKSVLNEKREKWKTTDAMVFGKRCHKFLLEGMDFFKHYNVHGMPNDDKKLWVSKPDWDKIYQSVQRIRTSPEGNEYFKLGYPEVSIFWRDPATGIMLRARVDYLRTFGAIDYKRIKGITTPEVGRAIRDQGLDIQAYLYCEGIERIRRLLRAGKITPQGTVDPAWLEAFTHDDDCIFRFFFQRSVPPYVWRIEYLDNDTMQVAGDFTRKAIQIYKHHIETYGPGEWPMGNGTATEFSFYNIPRRNYD